MNDVAHASYEDRIVTAFTAFAVIWALVGMAAGVYVAAELVWPDLGFSQPWLSYGRLRTVHTNAVIFGFAVCALIGTSFYSVQRTSHVRLFAPKLAWFVFYGWQVLVVLGAVSLLAGWTGGKEYAELEWPFDIAIAVLWVSYGIVFFGTIAKRTMRADLHLELVLRRADHRHRDAAHREQSGHSGHARQELLAVPRCAGCHRAVVVRPQRRRLPADGRFLRNALLLLAEASRAADLELPALDRRVLGVRVQLHLGGTASSALQRDPRMGAVARRRHERRYSSRHRGPP